MDSQDLAVKVVEEMIAKDAFSKWLGITCLHIAPGSAVLQLTIRQDMLNGFQTAHGGITYCLADSALGFASNSHGRKAVSIETSISHIEALHEGDVITAVAEELSLSTKIGVYQITLKGKDQKTVAHFKGTVYRTSKLWFPEPETKF
jgi:acyl-CoA thioesterase